jgi:hypothetical protein
MSDYRNPNDFDKYGNPIPGSDRPFDYAPAPVNGRAPYVLLGILILVGIVGGAMYFNAGNHDNPRRPDVAQMPSTTGDTSTQTPAPSPMTTTTPNGPSNSTRQ